MRSASRPRLVATIAFVLLFSLGFQACETGTGSPFLLFRSPLFQQLSLPAGVQVLLQIGGLVDETTLTVAIDGQAIDPGDIVFMPGGGAFGLGRPGSAETVLPDLAEGRHMLEAHAVLDLGVVQIPLQARTWFNIVDLERPDECEILNAASCALPFPSSAFLEDVGAETETGLRMNFPELTLTGVVGPPLDPAPLNVYDGFAPTVQILVHLEGADLAVSGVSRLLAAGTPQSPPYVGVRTHDDSSLDTSSPTVLIDADTGERILHWVELDQTPPALADPARQTFFIRPAQSLVPGHRYIVAIRRIKDAAGRTLRPEPVFRNLRDGRPSTIDALEARRDNFEFIFRKLRRAGVRQRNLQLAFDFSVRSEKQLHERMLAMRDDSMAYLAGLAVDDVSGFANLDVQDFGDCVTDPNQVIWRQVNGTFDGPNYMDGDIDNAFVVSLLNVDADRMPVRNGVFPLAWSISVPCEVYLDNETGYPLLLGHGFLGDGKGMVDGFSAGGFFGDSPPINYIAGATDWRGLSRGFTGPDALNILFNVIGSVDTGHKFNTFAALPDRLKQGVVNTLVLSRMMKSGFFNRLPELQRTPGDAATGVFTPANEMFYFGVSLGGIYGTMYAALNQDTIRHNVDVPSMNFSVLEQRSTQFPVFLALLDAVGLTDPMELALTLGIQHEMWVSAEPAAYIRNVTGLVDPPLANTPAKKMLVTVAFLDKQVSNNTTNIFARSMGIPNIEGSIQAQLVGLPDVNADSDGGGPGLDSAMHIYDTGYFDIFNPLHEPFLPPLANIIPSTKCDPHGGARLSIPNSIDQLGAFLQPGGTIFNFCDGICDAQTVDEMPASPCDPLN